jgi:hypothetical protein
MTYAVALFAAVMLWAGSGFGQGWRARSEMTLSTVLAPFIEIASGPIDWSRTHAVDFAYANCPFTANLGGDHPGRNPAISRITLTINGEETALVDWSRGVVSFPVSRAYTETPHDGQVKLGIYMRPDSTGDASRNMTITLVPL